MLLFQFSSEVHLAESKGFYTHTLFLRINALAFSSLADISYYFINSVKAHQFKISFRLQFWNHCIGEA
jgi:hypothetical protein